MARKRSTGSRADIREIEVEVSGGEAATAAGGEPGAFSVGGQRHVVAEIVDTWRDESFGGPSRKGRDAWLGHERTFYRVRTEAGELFDIYFDLAQRRRRGKARWVLHRRLRSAVAPTAPAAPAEARPAPTTEEQPTSPD